MALIKSISGIRGTIGGKAGDGLGGVDIVRFTSAYAEFIRRNNPKARCIAVGRDARISGSMVDHLVCGALMAMGLDVINIGKATTPTTELAVTGLGADGGIIITASHNPVQWNALKLLNSRGEFLSDAEGKEVIAIAEAEDYRYAEVFDLGKEYKDDTWAMRHIQMVKELPLVDCDAIEAADFTVAVDAGSYTQLTLPTTSRV
ncbi:MAG: phosphoglucosamine mutase, partial [Muribaculaceae bacterium]|nr:phosphoglucosamine mutase [Muribaculaceae bacterium]